MVQMSMLNPSHGKYEHGKSESCEAYHVKSECWYIQASHLTAQPKTVVAANKQRQFGLFAATIK